jgi:hypothetical protein
MNEDAIAQQQQQNVPQPAEHTPAPITAPELTGFGDASIDLDEMTQYKLHDLFDAKYDPNDNETRQRLQYIYTVASDGLEAPDYVTVASKIRETMRIAGITHSDKKLYKLYQFMRLSNVMKKTSQEMELLSDG